MNISKTLYSDTAVDPLDGHRPAGQVEHRTQHPTLPRATEAPLVFVTGASRSGTTMLARMLGAHSEILTFNELHYFGSLWDPGRTGQGLSAPELSELAAVLLARQERGLWGGQPSQVERSWGRRLVRDMPAGDCNPVGLYATTATRLARDAGKTLACEQTPRNIFYAERLLEWYPNARVVHIMRDPRAVLASQKNRWKMRKMGAHHLPLSEMLLNRVNYHPVTMSQLWRKAAKAADKLRDHPRFTIVHFEDLAAKPEAGSRQLCKFLDIDFEPAMLNIPRWGSSNVEHSNEPTGVSKEVNDNWRQVLSRGEIAICERITQTVMRRFGYTPELLDQQWLVTLPSLLLYPLHVLGVVLLNPGRAMTQLRAINQLRGPGARSG